MHITIVAGEASGDCLGVGLIQALREHYPNLKIDGIAGSKMQAQGCKTLYPMERLAVMGFIEPLKRLPELIKIRRHVRRHVLQNRPDVFIGIDSPDFNLGLEEAFKKAGIPTVHYVTPAVWAWRKWRIRKIARSVDLMLTLFPFEAEFYKKNHVPVKFVGHPFADQIPMHPDQQKVRKQFGISKDAKVLALLPGSREMELEYLAETFIRTASLCLSREPNLQIITAMFNEARKKQFEKILKETSPQLSVKIISGQSRDVMLSADVVLLTSGTATLEAMLLKRPMVVAYRTSKLMNFLVKLLVKVKYFALPNLIAGRKIISEFYQEEATPEILSAAIMDLLNNSKEKEELIQTYIVLHKTLKQNASQKAAKAIVELLDM